MGKSLSSTIFEGGFIFMQEMQIFNNPEFGEIRTIMIDNYASPKYLEEKINNCNAQMNINEERYA